MKNITFNNYLNNLLKKIENKLILKEICLYVEYTNLKLFDVFNDTYINIEYNLLNDSLLIYKHSNDYKYLEINSIDTYLENIKEISIINIIPNEISLDYIFYYNLIFDENTFCIEPYYLKDISLEMIKINLIKKECDYLIKYNEKTIGILDSTQDISYIDLKNTKCLLSDIYSINNLLYLIDKNLLNTSLTEKIPTSLLNICVDDLLPFSFDFLNDKNNIISNDKLMTVILNNLTVPELKKIKEIALIKKNNLLNEKYLHAELFQN